MTLNPLLRRFAFSGPSFLPTVRPHVCRTSVLSIIRAPRWWSSVPAGPAQALSGSTEQNFAQAGALLVQGDLQACIRVCDASLRVQTRDPAILMVRGEAFERSGDLPSAKRDYERALEMQEDTPGAALRLAQLLLRTAASEDDMRVALNHSDLAVRLFPRDPECHIARGDTLAKLREFTDADKSYDAAIAVDKGYLPAHLAKAALAQQRGEWSKAIATFDKAYASFPNFVEAAGLALVATNPPERLFCDMLLQRAWCYMQLKSFHQASLDLTAVIALESAPPVQKAKALHLRAKCFFQVEQWWKSIEDNSEALRLLPSLLIAYKDRAIAYDMVGREREAEEDRTAFTSLTQHRVVKQRLGIKEEPRTPSKQH
jgi:tetratricopeptide (TPR) repeat protein